MAGTEAVLRVDAAGLLTTVQDLGRPGWGRFGLPPGGALDDCALRWANLLAGNEPGAAALELTLLGPTLTYEGTGPVSAALAGTDFGASLNGTPQAPWQRFTLQPGDTLACGSCRVGARGYLAIGGGIDVPAALGSRSTDLRGRVGGLEGRALRAGDRLPLAPSAATPDESLALPADRIPAYSGEIVAHVVLGPQDDRFTEDAIVTFLSSPYTVTRDADRMGLRLEGPALAFRDGPAGADIISEGVATGAIQVPAHGQPIVLLAARQTTGGYAKIATVIGADLWRLGQARPGDTLRFRAIPIAEAQEATRRYRASFDPAVLESRGQRAVGNEAEETRRGSAGEAEAVLEAASSESWTPAAVQRLLDRVEALGLTEVTLDLPGLRFHLRRGTGTPPATSIGFDSTAPAADAGEFTITAPLIGVFYRSVRQGEAPLVAPGDLVEADQPLALIEVMKTFHEVTAGRRARVTAVLADDAAPVEYGQALFRMEPAKG
jgi:antagonist of KipI